MLHPHVPEELKHFGKHLFATFLGLLMALGLEQWREHRHETKLAHQALTAVEAELREGMSLAEIQSTRCEQSLRTVAELDAYLAELIAAKRQGKPLPQPREVGNLGIAMNFPTDAWETFKGFGALRQVTPDRARRLSRAYSTLTAIQQHFLSHPIARQVPASLIIDLEHPERLQNQDMARLEQDREGLQLMGALFRWSQHELVFVRRGCEAALRP
jgi:hypothetical protein